MKKSRSYRQWFILFCINNLVFLSLQFGFVFSDSSTFINAMPLPTPIYFELMGTLLIHLMLYLLLSALQTLLIWGLTQWHLSIASLERWHITICAVFFGALLSSNAYFFPLSRFSSLFLPELPHLILILVLLLLLFMMGLLILNMLMFALQQYPKTSLGTLMMGLGLFFYEPKLITFNQYQAEAPPPNVILIGVDSLNPYKINAKDMPTVMRFINQSVLFKETITPLARTYPSWSSILTGLYPEHHHAHYNLMPPDRVKNVSSIAWTLQRLGYQTLFATDDRRFSNMGKEFGFQTIIGPKIGANDLLLGSFNDFPLSNLLINLPISHWLFPYNYINRASHFSYYPQSFNKALQHGLSRTHRDAPMFMAVHFTLPHWPYTWAASSPQKMGDQAQLDKTEPLYQLGLQQVDQQVATLLSFLRKNGYLENSMVILLSDHGEALGLPGSRQTSATAYQGPGASTFVDYLQRKLSTDLNISMGHGSDLLSPDQYHCLLAFKIYQKNHLTTHSKTINTRVALIDIAPTILNFLNLPSSALDGLSLLNTLVSNEKPRATRFFIMESGMFANQKLTREKLLQIGQQFFTVDPKGGQLQLRKDKLSALDAMKLYAVIDGNWVLALYPDDKGYIPIIQRLSDGKWTDELGSDFAKNSPAKPLLQHLQEFYKKNWTICGQKAGYKTHSRLPTV